MSEANLHCQEPADLAEPVLPGQAAGAGAAEAHDVITLDTPSHRQTQSDRGAYWRVSKKDRVREGGREGILCANYVCQRS